jgi:hypothetical protein
MCEHPRVSFVPETFEPPSGLVTERFRLEPLGPQHNERDHAAWSSSMDHIRATAGFADPGWPREMTLEENLRDLERHAGDFRARTGFTYSVLDPAGRDVIGCVYIYPDKHGDADARVASWVRATHAQLDLPLRETISRWLGEAWPFARVAYAAGDRGA